MKRQALLRHLRRYGCSLKREGRSHSLWMNPRAGEIETVPPALGLGQEPQGGGQAGLASEFLPGMGQTEVGYG